DAILAADYVLDIGPGAGVNGGNIVGEATPQDVLNHPDSLTGKYLSGRMGIPVPTERRTGRPGKALSIKGATGNNLKNVSVDVPLGLFVAITGVSGGGKSTLMIDTMYQAIARRL